MANLEINVWEEIPAQKTAEELLADVEAVIKHIDGKQPFGMWTRETEMKGCWLDVQESLDNIRQMGNDDVLTWEVNFAGQKVEMARTRAEEIDRIAYKLDGYYGDEVKGVNGMHAKIAKALEIEYLAPPTNTIDMKIDAVDKVLNYLETKIPKGVISRESECYGCWLDIKEELENLKEMGDYDGLEFKYDTPNGPRTAILKKEQCLERIDYKLDLYYGTTNMNEALSAEYNMPAPQGLNKNKNKNKGIGLDH